MTTLRNRLDTVADASLRHPEVVVAASLYYSVTERARAARKNGDKGAVSIEQAIITIAVIAFAIVVLTAISLVVKNLTAKVKTPTVPNGK